MSDFNERLKKIIADGLIDQLGDAKSQYSRLQKDLDCSKYLKEITDDVIFKALSDTIKENHNQPFVNFNQDHRDQYNRLKFRSFYSDKIEKHGPLP